MIRSDRQSNPTVRLCMLALLTALCFVSNYIQVPIATVGSVGTRIHFGNIFCLLSGFLLGPISGGLAAGTGAFLFDLTNPLYIAESPITFLFKFTMAAVCGLIAKNGKPSRRIIGGICGAMSYLVLYLSKSVIVDVWVKNLEWGTAAVNLATKGAASGVNGVIAVVFAVPLAIAVEKAVKAIHLEKTIFPR